jgi:hypothetical protein
MISISPDTESASYSLDLLRDVNTGDIFIATTVGQWDDFGFCTGSAITMIAGPLDRAEVAHVTASPRDWDEDPSFDLAAVNALVADGTLVYDHTLTTNYLR